MIFKSPKIRTFFELFYWRSEGEGPGNLARASKEETTDGSLFPLRRK